MVLRGDADCSYGIDIAYVAQEILDRQTDESTMIDGAPTLAIEVLSPSDTVEGIQEKIEALLSAGTACVWIVDPHFETIQEYRKGRKSKLFTTDDEITVEPEMPGFRVAVSRIFNRRA